MSGDTRYKSINTYTIEQIYKEIKRMENKGYIQLERHPIWNGKQWGVSMYLTDKIHTKENRV